MAIDFFGATVKKATVSVGTIVGFTLPTDELREREDTGLADTRVVMTGMAIKEAQEFIYTIRLNPEVSALTASKTVVAWEIVLPKQTSGSTAGMTHDFNGYVVSVGGVSGDVGTSEGVTQEIRVRVVGEQTITPEA